MVRTERRAPRARFPVERGGNAAAPCASCCDRAVPRAMPGAQRTGRSRLRGLKQSVRCPAACAGLLALALLAACGDGEDLLPDPPSSSSTEVVTDSSTSALPTPPPTARTSSTSSSGPSTSGSGATTSPLPGTSSGSETPPIPTPTPTSSGTTVPPPGCGGEGDFVAGEHEPCRMLSGFGLFDGLDARGWPVPVEGSFVYTLNTSLFSDETLKLRTIWMPEGSEPIAYEEVLPFRFPVGTIITKTFAVAEDLRDADTPVRIIETRLLILEPEGWRAVPYEWEFEGVEPVDARLRTIGRSGIVLEWIDREGEDQRTEHYRIPARTECGQCHREQGFMDVIGPKARHLNGPSAWDEDVENQLTWWAEEGWLTGLPEDLEEVPATVPAFDEEAGSLDARARGWLDINCAHCHNDTSDVASSGLDLRPTVVQLSRIGVCKTPSSAGGEGSGGRQWDIVPGHPDLSVTIYRLEQDFSNSIAMMPRLGRSIPDHRATALIREWIEWLGTEAAEERYPGVTTVSCVPGE